MLRSTHGSVYLGSESARASLRRREIAPSSGLTRFVRCYWQIEWDLDPSESLVQLVLPRTCVFLSFENPTRRYRSKIVFPRHKVISASLTGKQTCAGIEFRPGAFSFFWPGDLSRIDLPVLPLTEFFPTVAERLTDEVLAAPCFDDKAQLFDDFLMLHAPREISEDFVLLETLVRAITEDDDLCRVSELTEKFGLSESKIQRLFARHIGVSPKLMIRTRRFLEAIEAVVSGQAVAWAALAQDLGYSDQAHFNNEFRSVTGHCPSDLRRVQAAGFLQDPYVRLL